MSVRSEMSVTQHKCNKSVLWDLSVCEMHRHTKFAWIYVHIDVILYTHTDKETLGKCPLRVPEVGDILTN